jgi:membrane protein implicated in regulation of membrane protease activity
VVRESIDNLEGRGAVYIDGKIWSARSEDGTEIEADAVVTPVRIEGVKLIVKRDNK